MLEREISQQPENMTVQDSAPLTLPLSDFIRGTIRERGPVPFRWFMEQALYHPDHGYYSSGRAAIGRGGDYFTNVSVGPLFGSLLAAQFAEMWDSLGRPSNFMIVEQGGHHGDFARDVLESTHDQAPEFFNALHYEIIEPFTVLRARQESALISFREKIAWRNSVDSLAPFCGVHFCNELLDAMPVHLIAAAGCETSAIHSAKSIWLEKYVTTSAEGFELIDRPISTAQLQERLRKLPPLSLFPYQTEVNLAALDWIEALSRKLERGYVLMVDYGYPRQQFYAPERVNGTLRCHAKHRVVSSPFTDIGNTDMTAHIDWTSLAERAEKCGLLLTGFADQHHFITGIATSLIETEFSTFDPKQRRALQTLLHPSLLGLAFQFLGLSKAVRRETRLSGFKFAPNPRAVLGLL